MSKGIMTCGGNKLKGQQTHSRRRVVLQTILEEIASGLLAEDF